MSWIEEKVTAVLTGAAVGDALGGATEGWTPAQIQERHGGRVEGVVPPFLPDWRTARPIAPYHKGDGHVTDDTLMTHALIDVYADLRRHLSAYDIASHLVPLMIGERRWVPELEDEALILQRVFLAEKWLVARLHYGHIDPREAGVGNVVNCGATMYMAPVGLVNLGDPRAAYAEAIDVAGAHQSSYGREAAGVFAAAVAEAARPGATVESVLDTCLELAHDGTAQAVAAVVTAGTEQGGSDPEALGQRLRDAVRPFDTVGEEYRAPALDARIPSRTKSIEELPVALGLVAAHRGDTRAAILGAVNYGRDSDSIATMAGAICAGLQGQGSVPSEWVSQITTASRLDLAGACDRMATVVRDVLAADRAAAAERVGLLDGVLAQPTVAAAEVLGAETAAAQEG